MLDPDEVDIDSFAYPGKEGTIEREPRGVVAVIMPWNFPFALPLRTIVPALLAGNAVVFKPSEVTPKSGELVVELLRGLVPDGVLGLVQGVGRRWARRCAARTWTSSSSPEAWRPGARSRTRAPRGSSRARSSWAGRTRRSSWPTRTSSGRPTASSGGR